ncbi:MAG: penicillin acylase family protein [Rubrivivax sp.]|nr:MAG: penicillin acylase family protein [Rubrivivax sp.]
MSAAAGAGAATPFVGTPVRDLPAGAVDIRRTTDGIAHIRAGDMRGAGFGMGLAQAQDTLCTLAEAFVTYEGRRSFFFGPDGTPRHVATFAQARNLDLDVFFRAFVDAEALAAYKMAQSPPLLAALEGFAEGYNRSLSEQRQQAGRRKVRSCLFEPWVRPITVNDLMRRLYAVGLAAGYAHFVPELAGAHPPSEAKAKVGRAAMPAWPVGERVGLGSNALAFGREATGGGSALLGNPHWYWGGPDRFYQAHITIPGQLDVAGVSLLGVPLIMIGFNADVAWSHTVSNASRFSFHALTLDPSDPLVYIVDGQPHRMEPRTVTVQVKGPRGKMDLVTRTLYRTRFGPVIDLGSQAPALGWTRATAVAMHDVNADNARIFQNYLDWNQARSLDELVAIQKKAMAIPWVNTLAIGRGDPRAWYSAIGAVPNVPDDLKADCRNAMGDAFAQIDPRTPFLDGSRSACDWRRAPGTPQAGIMPADLQPSLFRRDYVANMNDSHWLSQPLQPLEGYAGMLGGERQALSLRGRHGHAIARDLLSAHHTSLETFVPALKRAALTERDYAADQYKDAILRGACVHPVVSLASPEQQAKASPARPVPVGEACRILARWRNTGGPHDQGALLWAAFWDKLEALNPGLVYDQGFDAGAPLDTPAAPRSDDQRLAQALAATVAAFMADQRPLNEPLGQRLHVLTGGRRVALFGGCGAGYFTVACADDQAMGGRLGARSVANSYLQLVRFGPHGVEADTLLAHGLDENAVEGGQGSEPVVRYARKQWLSFPFSDAAIEQQLVQRRRVWMAGAAR